MQLATLLIGLMSATALWSGVQAINGQARSSYDRAANAFGRNAMLVPTHDVTVPQSLFAELRRAGWLVSPVIEGSVRIGGRAINLVGVEPLSLPRSGLIAPDVEQSLQDFLSPAGQTLIAPETAAELRLQEGATVATESGERLPPLHITAGFAPNMLVTDIGFAQRILRKPERISRFLIDPEPAGARAALQDVAGDRLRLVEAGSETDLQRLTASFHLNLTAFGLLSFLVGLFIVHSAIGLSFEQRLPMLRNLRACGVSASGLVAALTVELLVFAVVAGIGGVFCGYLIASALLPDVAASLRGLYGASVSGRLTLAPEWLLAGLAMSLAGALVAAAQALVKVMRLPLLVSAQPLAWRVAQQRWLAWQGGLACAAFAVAALSYLTGESLIAGFAVLAGLLLGAALLLPPMLSIILRAGERAAQRPVALWAWADSRQQLPGLSLALMALLLALAVNVGVGTMVGSFSGAFHRWLDGRLVAEMYLAAKDDARANAIEAWLRQRSDVDAVLRSARAETKIGGEAVELFGLADHTTYRTLWPLLDSKGNAWDEVRDGAAVLVSEQLSRRLGLRLGDQIRIPSPGGDWIVRVAALYADYGNPKGQIVVNADQLRGKFPLADSSRFGVRVAPASRPAADGGAQAKVRRRHRCHGRSGDVEGGGAPHLQPDLCDHRGAQCLYVRRRRRRAVHKSVDARAGAPAATRAALGDRPDAPAHRGTGVRENHCTRPDDRTARAAARPCRGLVPDRGGECAGVRLAAAAHGVPDATCPTLACRNAGRMPCYIAADHQTVADASHHASEDFRR